jgi:glycosyltransferase involved in cell wall biosynthesis
LKVVWISHRSGLAGAELALVEGVAALAERGTSSLVVLPWEGPLRGRLEALGARVAIVPHVRWASAPGGPRRLPRRAARTAVAAGSLVRLLRRERPDAVLTNTLTVPAGALAARIVRTPHLWCVHEFGEEGHGIRLDLGSRATFRAIAGLSRLVLVNSEAIRRHLAGHGVQRLRVVPYAVDTVEVEPVAGRDGEMRAVLVATLAPQKGQTDAIGAVAELAARGVHVRLRLVGPDHGGYGLELEQLAAAARVADRVELVGFVEQPERELAAADVALTCARLEAFGRVTVEAMKLGVPVVAADSGGTPELVRDGETGLLYEPGDVSALAERLARLAGDPELRQRLAGTAGEWARSTFTRERYGAALAAALEDAIG